MPRRKREKPQDGDMLPIRNPTAEFLTFVRASGADAVAVRFPGEDYFGHLMSGSRYES